MKKFYNPELKVTSFDKEAIGTTVSGFQETINNWVEDGEGRQSATVNYEEMQSVSFDF